MAIARCISGTLRSVDLHLTLTLRNCLYDAHEPSVSRGQASNLAASALAPFQRLAEDISQGLFGRLYGLMDEAQKLVEGAQSQLSDSVTESIGNPLQVSTRALVRRNAICNVSLFIRRTLGRHGCAEALCVPMVQVLIRCCINIPHILWQSVAPSDICIAFASLERAAGSWPAALTAGIYVRS